MSPGIKADKDEAVILGRGCLFTDRRVSKKEKRYRMFEDNALHFNEDRTGAVCESWRKRMLIVRPFWSDSRYYIKVYLYSI